MCIYNTYMSYLIYYILCIMPPGGPPRAEALNPKFIIIIIVQTITIILHGGPPRAEASHPKPIIAIDSYQHIWIAVIATYSYLFTRARVCMYVRFNWNLQLNYIIFSDSKTDLHNLFILAENSYLSTYTIHSYYLLILAIIFLFYYSSYYLLILLF